MRFHSIVLAISVIAVGLLAACGAPTRFESESVFFVGLLLLREQLLRGQAGLPACFSDAPFFKGDAIFFL